jgi:diguanylate cyclase (GGDEF) domain
MLKTPSAILPRDPDPAIFEWFERIEYACLTLLILISLASVFAWLMPTAGWIMVAGWLPMKAESGIAVLLSTLCLMFLGTGQKQWKRWVCPLLAGIVVLRAAFVLLRYPQPYIPAMAGEFARSHGLPEQISMSPHTAGALLLLGLIMIAMVIEDRIAVWIGDVLTLMLCVLTLTLVSSNVFGKIIQADPSAGSGVLSGTLLCLFLLTVMTLLRRTENGIFSIYTGTGNAGKMARILSPILLLLPFLRETARARVIGSEIIPRHFITALLASTAAIVSIMLLMYLVWRINAMENEINTLALRDELTGLYNLRGFQMLAEQAMRLAQRSKVPFSVMFIDLDDLKLINDSLGHKVGSAYISEAAELLRTTFRETDVLGRVGGDEFAVAGQFNQRAVSFAVQRLKAECARKNDADEREFNLSLSIGHATQRHGDKETLEKLMVRADEAMYEVKRLKKEHHSTDEQRPALAGKGAAAS